MISFPYNSPDNIEQLVNDTLNTLRQTNPSVYNNIHEVINLMTSQLCSALRNGTVPRYKYPNIKLVVTSLQGCLHHILHLLGFVDEPPHTFIQDTPLIRKVEALRRSIDELLLYFLFEHNSDTVLCDPIELPYLSIIDELYTDLAIGIYIHTYTLNSYESTMRSTAAKLVEKYNIPREEAVAHLKRLNNIHKELIAQGVTHECRTCGQRRSVELFRLSIVNLEPFEYKINNNCRLCGLSKGKLSRKPLVTDGNIFNTKLLPYLFKQCTVCTEVKPIYEFNVDLETHGHTMLRVRKGTCRKCNSRTRKKYEAYNVVNEYQIHNELGSNIVIMNEERPELAVINAKWLLDPDELKYWYARQDVLAKLHTHIKNGHPLLTSIRARKLIATSAAEQLKRLEPFTTQLYKQHYTDDEVAKCLSDAGLVASPEEYLQLKSDVLLYDFNDDSNSKILPHEQLEAVYGDNLKNEILQLTGGSTSDVLPLVDSLVDMLKLPKD